MRPIRVSSARRLAEERIKRAGTKRLSDKSIPARSTGADRNTQQAERAHTIESLSQFVSYVEKQFNDDLVLFRGQAEDKPLIPRIARIKLREDLLQSERRMIDEFIRRSLPFLKHIPGNRWDWLALAQHHGLATRLLDWTENALAALWFAVERPPIIAGQNGVVWVFRSPERVVDGGNVSDPFEIAKPMAFKPNHVTNRIVAQSGWFTAHDSRFVALDQGELSEGLIKIIVEGNAFPDIRYHLDRCGINQASLFPDLDGLSKYVEWTCSFMKDEPDA